MEKKIKVSIVTSAHAHAAGIEVNGLEGSGMGGAVLSSFTSRVS